MLLIFSRVILTPWSANLDQSSLGRHMRPSPLDRLVQTPLLGSAGPA